MMSAFASIAATATVVQFAGKNERRASEHAR